MQTITRATTHTGIGRSSLYLISNLKPFVKILEPILYHVIGERCMRLGSVWKDTERSLFSWSDLRIGIGQGQLGVVYNIMLSCYSHHKDTASFRHQQIICSKSVGKHFFCRFITENLERRGKSRTQCWDQSDKSIVTLVAQKQSIVPKKRGCVQDSPSTHPPSP